MFNFSELFMEDCFVEQPSAFISDIVEILDRQATIGGFRPDVFALDKEGKHCIIELQQRALDRTHLYKCLEYRDLWQGDNGIPRVILLCEDLPSKYIPILETHNIELVNIPRDKFLKLAAHHCPKTLSKHFVEELNIRPDIGSSISKPEVFTPCDWRYPNFFNRLLSDFQIKLTSAGINPEKDFRPYQLDVYRDVDDFYEYTEGVLPREMIDLNYIHIPSLLTAYQDEILPVLNDKPWNKRVRKPQVEIVPYLTSKGNLSVVWRPFTNGGTMTNTDFKLPPHSEALAYHRPPDELMFIRGVSSLRVSDTQNELLRRDETCQFIDEYLLRLTITKIESLVTAVSVHCSVNQDFQIEVDLYDDEDERFLDKWSKSIKRPSAWRIFSREQRKTDAEDEWFNNFGQTYKCSIRDFISAWDRAANKPNRASKNAYKYMATEGIDLDPKIALSIMNRIKKHHRWILDQNPISDT